MVLPYFRASKYEERFFAESVKFAVLSDTHIGLSEKKNTYKMFHYNDRILLDMIEDINAIGDVDFVLVPGDLTKDSEPYNHKEAKEILDVLAMPYFAVPGNHDVIKVWSSEPTWGIEEFVTWYDMPWYR